MTGIRWREFSAIELLWFYHAENVIYYRDNAPAKMKEYLRSVGDVEMERAWDNRSFAKETDLATGGAPNG